VYTQAIRLHDKVYFPPTLDLSKYVGNPKAAAAAPTADKGEEASFSYDLYALLIHRGSATGGHYFAYIKNSKDGKWYCFDDSHVSAISDADVKKMMEHPDVAEAREKAEEAKRKAHEEETRKAMAAATTTNNTADTEEGGESAIPPPPGTGISLPPPPGAKLPAPPLSTAKTTKTTKKEELAKGKDAEKKSGERKKYKRPFAHPSANAYMVMYQRRDKGGDQIDNDKGSSDLKAFLEEHKLGEFEAAFSKAGVTMDILKKTKKDGGDDAAADDEFWKSLSAKCGLKPGHLSKLKYAVEKLSSSENEGGEEIEEALRKEIEQENAKWHEKFKEWKRQQEMIEANVFFGGDYVRISMHKSKTVEAAVKNAISQHLELNKDEDMKRMLQDVKLSNIRLREYDGLKKRGTRPIQPMSFTLEKAEVKKHQALFLEVKKDGEEFEEYIPDQMQLALMTYDKKTDKITGPSFVEVDEKGARGSQLRNNVAKLWKMKSSRIVLMCQDPITGPKIIEDTVGLEFLKIRDGSQVFAEVCDEGTTHTDCAKPALLEKFERDKYILVVAFNDPRDNDKKPPKKKLEQGGGASTPGAAAAAAAVPPPPLAGGPGGLVPPPPGAGGLPPPPVATAGEGTAMLGAHAPHEYQTHNIEFDTRKTLGEFREALAKQLGLDKEAFKIRKMRYGPELKETKKTLNLYNFAPPCAIWLDMGAPLKSGEYILKLHGDLGERTKNEKKKKDGGGDGKDAKERKLEAKALERFAFLSDIKLQGGMSMLQVKQEIGKIWKPDAGGPPSAQYMRVRELKGEKLGILFVDDKTLKKNKPGLQDFEAIVVQRTAVPEVTTSNTLLLNVYQWYPDLGKLGDPVEMAFGKHWKLPKLQETLAKLGGGTIPAEEVKVVKPMKWQLKDETQIPLLKWNMRKLNKNSKIGSAPWRARSGDNILFKDGRIPEKIEKQPDILPTGISQPGPEPGGIKILSLEEIEERERRIEEAEKKYREDAEKKKAEGTAPDGPPPPPSMPPPAV